MDVVNYFRINRSKKFRNILKEILNILEFLRKLIIFVYLELILQINEFKNEYKKLIRTEDKHLMPRQSKGSTCACEVRAGQLLFQSGQLTKNKNF